MSSPLVFLKTRSDVHHLRGGELVASEDPELLKESLKRHPKAIIPTYTRSFYRQEGLVELAKEAGVPFELPLLPILRSSSTRRARLLYEYRRFIRFCEKKKAKYWLILIPESPYDAKSARELESIATVFFGLTKEQARKRFA